MAISITSICTFAKICHNLYLCELCFQPLTSQYFLRLSPDPRLCQGPLAT
jgi:hypothetical protein